MEDYIVLNLEDLRKAIENSIFTRRVWGRRVWDVSNGIRRATDCVEVDGITYEIHGVVTACFYIYYLEDNAVKKVAAFTTKNLNSRNVEITSLIAEKRESFYYTYGEPFTNPLYMSCGKTKSIDDWISWSLDESVGHDISTISANVKQYYTTWIRGKGYADKNEKARWEKLSDTSRLFIIGVDRRFIDVFPTGFSIRVSLTSDKSFKDQKMFAKENGKEILRYAINEIPHIPKINKKIGDIKFYKPVEITVLRTNELDVKFEVKNLDSKRGAIDVC